jgi:hypothetical protein
MKFFLKLLTLLLAFGCSNDTPTKSKEEPFSGYSCDFFREDGSRAYCVEKFGMPCSTQLGWTDVQAMYGSPTRAETVTSCPQDSVIKICQESYASPNSKIYVYRSYWQNSICAGRVMEFEVPFEDYFQF